MQSNWEQYEVNNSIISDISIMFTKIDIINCLHCIHGIYFSKSPNQKPPKPPNCLPETSHSISHQLYIKQQLISQHSLQETSHSILSTKIQITKDTFTLLYFLCFLIAWVCKESAVMKDLPLALNEASNVFVLSWVLCPTPPAPSKQTWPITLFFK